MPLSHRQYRGITLTEITVILIILFVLGAVLYPIFARPRRSRRDFGISNQKQIALGFLQYIQDYDERFPPGIGYVTPSPPLSNDKQFAQSWGPDRIIPDGRIVPGLLSPYTKSNQLFVDNKAPRYTTGAFVLHYLYNDLLIGVKQERIVTVTNTVLLTDSENRFANVGHALDLDAPPLDARFNAKGGCDAGQGATVGREARFRHSGGANFAYTDGHVKWASGSTDTIFFPSRASASVSAVNPRTKTPEGPVPGAGMSFGGRNYVGTFHIR